MSTSQIASLSQSAPAQVAPSSAGRTETVRAAAIGQGTQPAAKAAAPSEAELAQAVDKLNKFTEAIGQSVNFSIDRETDKVVVKVMDTVNNTVLRQFPSEEALALTRAIDKLQGVFLKSVKA